MQLPQQIAPPRYLVAYDDRPLYWSWEGESQVRMTLVYQQPDNKHFQHEFIFARVKAK